MSGIPDEFNGELTINEIYAQGWTINPLENGNYFWQHEDGRRYSPPQWMFEWARFSYESGVRDALQRSTPDPGGR